MTRLSLSVRPYSAVPIGLLLAKSGLDEDGPLANKRRDGSEEITPEEARSLNHSSSASAPVGDFTWSQGGNRPKLT